MPLRAVIFDLGGTLIDWPDWDEDIHRRWALSYDYLTAKLSRSNWPERQAYALAMREAEKKHWQRVVEKQTSGTPTDVLREGFQLLGRLASEEELLVALDGYAQAVNGWAIIFPDTVQTLTELRKRGYLLGLLSNTWWAAAWHNADLATHGLTSLLDEVVYTSDLPHSKPHPSTFLTVTTRLNVESGECVMVGDRLIDDISGAQGVGMRAVWKKTDYPWPKPEYITPTAVITDLTELLPLLEKWQRKESEL
ncbi:MAG TPA: HAD family hydrolase [Ktedonobacteraceae bacterium]|nr:HAD family hydrolase [Ktedonobacteraceae bacterium]